jgi:hypothetical protein
MSVRVKPTHQKLKNMKMTRSTWNKDRNGHIVQVGNRSSEAPYRFVGKTETYFLPAEITKKVGGIETALYMIFKGLEIGAIQEK